MARAAGNANEVMLTVPAAITRKTAFIVLANIATPETVFLAIRAEHVEIGSRTERPAFDFATPVMKLVRRGSLPPLFPQFRAPASIR